MLPQLRDSIFIYGLIPYFRRVANEHFERKRNAKSTIL